MDPKVYTTKDHLPGEDTVIVALYERFVELVGACGPFEYIVGWMEFSSFSVLYKTRGFGM